jgi:DtxR family Mn-dependent transcriptional regulator
LDSRILLTQEKCPDYSMNGTSESVEMYLKSIAELGGVEEPVPIGRVAERLGVSPVSASEMMKRLGDKKYVEHLPYKGVVLTNNGHLIANTIIRRQRLWECFLVDELSLDWARAFDLSCELEHATNSEISEALAAYLNNPVCCPHGNPIPDARGRIKRSDVITLNTLNVGQKARVKAIYPESSDILTYLGARGIRPGTPVEMCGVAPMDGPLIVRVDLGDKTVEIDLGQALAEVVIVELQNN